MNKQLKNGEWSWERGEKRANATVPAVACSIYNSPCALANWQSAPRPSPLPPRPMRKGMSLLEVLISIFVLTIGLLGVLSIIPLGQLTIAEAQKADRAGACGRAVMRDMKVQRWLDYRSWYWENGVWGIGYDSTLASPFFFIRDRDIPDASHPNINNNGIVIRNQVNPPLEAVGSFIIDPLGCTKGLPSILYGIQNTPFYLPRRTLSAMYLDTAYANTPNARKPIDGYICYWPDDIAIQPSPDTIDRPKIDPTVGLDNLRSWDYSWLLSVSPSSSDRKLTIPQRRLFDVTVAVFFKRNFDKDPNGYPLGEWIGEVKDISGLPAGAVSPGGGTITLGNAAMSNYVYRIKGDATNGHQTSPLNYLPVVREKQWAMLWDSNDGRLAWYRIIGVNFPDSPTLANPATLTLDGPDWIVTATTKLIVIDGAIGAYTSTVELDYDTTWQSMN